jgi:putative oxidoreductase
LAGPRRYHLDVIMSRIRWRLVLTLALRLVIALGFAVALVSKLGQRARWAHQFVVWGYPAWGADATSVIEIAGVIALWIPRLARTAMAILMAILFGAVCTWLIHGPGVEAMVPGTILVLLLCLAWLESTVKPNR